MADANVKKKQMEYIAITAMVLIAVLVGISRFKKGNIEDEVFSKKQFKEEWKEVEILEQNIPKEEKAVSYRAATDSTPFKSPFEDQKKIEEAAVEDVSLPSMSFEGMIWNSIRPQAIINNKVYDVNDIIKTGSEGDEFNVKVTDITREGIYLRYKGKDFLVKPKSTNVKQN